MISSERFHYPNSTSEHADSPDKEQAPRYLQIAIDGLVGAGKSEVAARLARALHLLYIDTGAMYRALTFLALEHGIQPDQEEELVKLFTEHEIELFPPTDEESTSRKTTVLVDGKDISTQLRTPQIDKVVSLYSQPKKVRQKMIEKQQELALLQPTIMEGRDTTWAGLPNAHIKIILDADPLVRAQRRFSEQVKKNPTLTLDEVYEDLMKRDANDMKQNLKMDSGLYIDTTNLSVDDVVDRIIFLANIAVSIASKTR